MRAPPMLVCVLLAGTAVAADLVAGAGSLAAEYKTTAEAPTLLYDGPSAKAKPLFVYGRDVPMEVLVAVEGWTKVRDMSGTIGWIAHKSLDDRRMVVVRVPVAEIRASPDESAPVVFRAERDVLLQLAAGAGQLQAAWFVEFHWDRGLVLR